MELRPDRTGKWGGVMGVIRKWKEFWTGARSRSPAAVDLATGRRTAGDWPEDPAGGKTLKTSAVEKARLAESLTPREKETCQLLLEGYSLKETAGLLGIGYSTANTYQTAIYKKLNVRTRAELIINYRFYGGFQKNGQ